MTPGSPDHRRALRADLLRFAAGSRHEWGFGYLDEHGHVDPARPVELYVTCRMTHVFSLGLLADEPPAPGGPDRDALAELVAHGLAALTGPLRDTEHGGWFAALAPDGTPATRKEAYGHAFVVLAASSARAAGVAGAQELLEAALAVHERYFWDTDAGLVVEEWDRTWSDLDPYRGVNSNMHTVEAYLAAGDVTGDPTWHHRAARIAGRVVEWARANDWRIPEHFTRDWAPLLDYNRDVPAHPFRPYGATVGHGLEWARLLLAVDATLGGEAPLGLVDAARRLTARAVADGWHADGAPGFVYTTDWSGAPVVRARMHWVAAEAICTSTALHRATGEPAHAEDIARWWAYADEHLIDTRHGSWHHELDAANEPAGTTWPGKPDAYHAYQAALMADVPLAPSFASALAARVESPQV
ncbi:MAG TPA: AGE family epimerase/isomerase [Phototrophicaceae bacterium]|nr:AGE family epimerase/isomerase [Phototrophicaceae bacterium]